MKYTIYVPNAILAASEEEINAAGLNLTCDENMNITATADDILKLGDIINPGDIAWVNPDKFDTMQEFVEWFNGLGDLLIDGYTNWSDIKHIVEASGWKFETMSGFICSGNHEGVMFNKDDKAEYYTF